MVQKDYEDLLQIKDEIKINMYHAANEYGLTILFPRQDLEVKLVTLRSE